MLGIECAMQARALWVDQSAIGPQVQAICCSVERHYVAEAEEVFDDVHEFDAPFAPDHIALPVKHVLIAMPDPFRSVLVSIYVRRMPSAALPLHLLQAIDASDIGR
jgi:hypothetical protein